MNVARGISRSGTLVVKVWGGGGEVAKCDLGKGSARPGLYSLVGTDDDGDVMAQTRPIRDIIDSRSQERG